MKIAESELIINPDGSIYHLHLRPGEVAETIITVGDQNRVAEVSKYFDRIELKREKREFVTHTGWLGKKRLTVISTGIGTDNIDIVFNELDALFNIDLEQRTIKSSLTALQFIRIGTSGCLQESIPIDSFLVSSAAIGFDGLLHYYPEKGNAHQSMQKGVHTFLAQHGLPQRPYVAHVGEGLLNQVGKNMQKGITLTCPGFYAPQGRALRIASTFSIEHLKKLASFQWNSVPISNFEMETAGIYGMANLLGHEAISFNALLANRFTGAFSKHPKETVEKLIQLVLERL